MKTKPDEQGRVRFSFTGQSWPDVLQWLADISSMSLDWQELPGDYLNLTTKNSYSVDQTRDLINRHLLARGYTLLQHGEVLSVVKTEKLNPGMVPRVEPNDLQNRSPHEFAKVSFTLDWLMADEAVEELKPMLSPNGKLTALTATNRLEAMDAVVNLQEIHRLLTEEQSPVGQDRLVREFVLRYARAADVRDQLEALLGIESKRGGGSAMPMSAQQMQQMQQQQAQQQAKMMAEMARRKQQGKKPGAAVKPRRQEKVQLVLNKRKNSILAHAPPDKMALIEQAVEMLDVPTDPSRSLMANMQRMHVYRLQTMLPEPLIKTLEELADLDPTTRLEADSQNKTLIAYAPLADHVTIRALVDKLDGGGRKSVVIPLKVLRAKKVAETVAFMMDGKKKDEPQSQGRSPYDFFDRYRSSRYGSRSSSQSTGDQFRVDADERNNSLMLWANEFEVAKVEELLDNLRKASNTDSEPVSVAVYRLAMIDPEPLVKTLQDTGSLDPRTSLEVDEKNNAIIARACDADHETIRNLVDKLDGSGRSFEVIPLRRLDAEYVAGSIEFMMAGEKEQKEDPMRSRYRYIFDDYGRGNQDKGKTDQFRVDADIEHNRLLLWANDIELDEVRKLLVKLGEIPPEGGDSRTSRVIDTFEEDELRVLLERLRRTWPSVAPNQLVLPPEEKSEEPAPEKSDTPPKTSTTQNGRPLIRFAALQEQTAEPSSPAEKEPAEKKPAEKGPPPPVTISRGVDGKLTISSQDTKALDLLEQLIADLAPPRKDYEIFKMKYAWAYSVALNLKEFFDAKKEKTQPRYDFFYGDFGSRRDQDNKGRDRLSKRRKLKFITDPDTNSILVQNASAGQLLQIKELIEFYDQPEPSDSQSIRKTQVIPIRYGEARVVADAVKDVYRDLLSSRDRTFAKNQEQQKQRPQSRYMYIYDVDEGEGSEQKKPRFQGDLSIGIDEVSNTLVISAQVYLFDAVTKLVEQLDEAAKPTTTTVTVLKVSPGLTAEKVHRALADVFGQGNSGRKPGGKKPGPPQPGPPQNGPPMVPGK